MNKLFLFLLLNIHLLLIPLPSNVFEDYGSSLDYNYYNKQNQILGSMFLKGKLYKELDNITFLNISLGLKTYEDKKPDFIYKLFLINSNSLIPILDEIEDTSSDRPLRPGYVATSFWNYLWGVTILDFDKSQIENSLNQWIQLRGGFGFNTSGIAYSNNFNFRSFIISKLIVSSVKFGEYNFNIFNDSSKFHNGFEAGITFYSDMLYKKDLLIKAELGYSLFKSDILINKINAGFNLDYNLYFPTDKFQGHYRDYIKFRIGALYFIYNFDKTNIEFIKCGFSINYFFYNQYHNKYVYE